MIAATPGFASSTVTLLITAVLSTSVLTAVVTSLLGRWATATEQRRQKYADAVATLVAWLEYPYRIKRRTSDDPAELARLAELGHGLQEQLRRHQTWITTEHQTTAAVFTSCLQAIGKLVGPCCRDAWASPAATRAADMNVGDWGPGAEGMELVCTIQTAAGDRFGIRRVWRFVFRKSAHSYLERARPINTRA